MTEQPEALHIADALEVDKWHISGVTAQAGADELRRLHEVNAELLAALELALPEIDCSTYRGDRAWDAVKAAIAKATGETE